jgi:peptide/nickel transport system substrate-binding protein
MKPSFNLLKHIFFFFWILASTSCSKSKAIEKDTLVIGIEQEIKNFDIRSSSDQNVWKLTLLTTQALLRITENGELLPSLALNYSIKNNRILEFELAPEQFFHNKTKVSCPDILYSYADSKRPGSRLLSYLEKVDKYECSKKNLFKIYLKEPIGEIFLRSVAPMIRIFPESIAQNEAQFQKHPMGSGPYQFIKNEKGKVTLEAFPQYPLKLPFKKIILKPIHSAHTQFMTLISGDIDLSWAALNDSLLPDIKKYKNLRSYKEANSFLFYIGLNLNDPLLKERQIRQYLENSTPRQKIFEEKISSNGFIADGFFLKKHSYYFPIWSAQVPQQEISPTPIRLSMNIPAQEEIQSWAKALQQEWKARNIILEIKSFEFARFIDSLKKGDYQSFLYKTDTKGDPDWLYQVFHSSQTPPRLNRFYLNSKPLDLLLEKARPLKEGPQRKRLYQKAQILISQEKALIPLWFPSTTIISNEKLSSWNSEKLNLIDFLSGF